jgi:hypothetical protein
VLIHADTELGAKDLLNNRMAYVAVSRGAYDAQIFTNDREKLGAALGHDVSHSSAHAPEMKPEQKQEQAVTKILAWASKRANSRPLWPRHPTRVRACKHDCRYPGRRESRTRYNLLMKVYVRG